MGVAGARRQEAARGGEGTPQNQNIVNTPHHVTPASGGSGVMFAAASRARPPRPAFALRTTADECSTRLHGRPPAMPLQ